MNHTGVDTGALTKLWDQRWPGCSKVPGELRGARDRWVRFHTLPRSKRYPDGDSDYEIILHRHNEVLAELMIQPALFVVTSGYSGAAKPWRR